MIGRFRGALRERIALLFAPRCAPVREHREEREVIQGCAGNVIIVKSPNTEYFKEAIFILCDDPLARQGVERQQFLREARRAARAYTAEHVPPRDLTPLWHLFFFLLGAASALIVLILLKLF